MGNVEASSRELREVQAKTAQINEEEDAGLADNEREAGLALLEIGLAEAKRLAALKGGLERLKQSGEEQKARWAEEQPEVPEEPEAK